MTDRFIHAIKELNRKMEFFEKQKEMAIGKVIKEYWYDKIFKDGIEVMKSYIPDGEYDDMEKYIIKRHKGSRYKYLMVTVNFIDNLKPGDVMKKVEKCMRKKWIVNSLTCFEWRGKDYGLHIHSKMEIREGKKVYDCKREIYNTFKNLVGNKMHVNVRYSNKEGCFEKYIDGKRLNKSTGLYEEKDCMAMTRIMRKKYGIDNIYVSAMKK